jgi:parvulin-like peptidyl-prolyl isomerase
MIAELLLAAAVTAAAAPPPPAVSAKAVLKAASVSAPACKAAPAGDGLVEVKLFSPEGAECAVARVGEETVALRELAALVEARHLARSPRMRAPATPPAMEFTPELDRLINARLFVQEAKEIQLDQQAEIKEAMEKHRVSTLRDMVQAIGAKGAKPDPKEVEKLYRDTVREWKLSSVLVDQEPDAKALAAAVKGGADLQAAAKKLVAEKKARGDGKSQWVPRKKMLPELLTALQDQKQGAVVGPIQLGTGWVILRVDGFRYPKDAEARAGASDAALSRAQQRAIRAYYLGLVKKHAVVDEKLLASLDFEKGGEKGFIELAQDPRVVVTIQGDRPITVADLTNEVGKNFFHGIASPIADHKVNLQKDLAFEKLLGSRLFAREASNRKLAETSEFKREMEGYERALLFTAFVEKVILPDIKVTEADGLAFYEKHKAKFTAPEMVKLDGLAFEKAPDAEAALAKLKDGTDFAWMKTTAPGQVPVEKRTIQFDGRTLSASAMPADLAKAVAGAHAGDYRLYGAGDAEFYVVKVVEQTPPSTQPYPDVRDAIVKKVHGDKIDKAIAEYAAKLRKAQRVDVLLVRVTT